jgi:hypothetical protein
MFRRRDQGDGGAAGRRAAAAQVAQGQLQRIAVSGDARRVESGLIEQLRIDPDFDVVALAWNLAQIADAVLTGVVWDHPGQTRPLFDADFWEERWGEVELERLSGWRVEVTERLQPAVAIQELELGAITVEVQSTYARRVFDSRGTQIEGDHAPRPHRDRIAAERPEWGKTPTEAWTVVWVHPVA